MAFPARRPFPLGASYAHQPPPRFSVSRFFVYLLDLNSIFYIGKMISYIILSLLQHCSICKIMLYVCPAVQHTFLCPSQIILSRETTDLHLVPIQPIVHTGRHRHNTYLWGILPLSFLLSLQTAVLINSCNTFITFLKYRQNRHLINTIRENRKLLFG